MKDFCGVKTGDRVQVTLTGTIDRKIDGVDNSVYFQADEDTYGVTVFKQQFPGLIEVKILPQTSGGS